jgi:hypothetical protein
MPSDVRKAFGLPESAPFEFRAMPSLLGRSPSSLFELDGSAKRFRTSDGIAEKSTEF